MAVTDPAHLAAMLPTFDTVEETRAYRKHQLAAAFRVFGKFGFSEGVAGHITVRDPEKEDCFWVNPFGVSFNRMTPEDLILVNHEGEIVEGKHTMLNGAAFAIHSRVHHHRPDVVAAAHAHSVYGKAWSSIGRLLDPITQDSCAFYQDHAIYDDYTGVVLDTSEGDAIAEALGDKKAAILLNHGLLTVGNTVEAAAWWFICMERCCQAQIAAESSSTSPRKINHKVALKTRNEEVGFPTAGWFQYQPIYQDIIATNPDLVG